jgi:endonuclease YncB( thermonuclease family)
MALAALALALPAAPLAAGDRYRGQVVSVQDGDTITVQSEDFERMRVRLYGIDCPENRQAYGDQAKAFLDRLVRGKTVDLEVLDVDRYSRQVALVMLDGELVNSKVAEAGFAWTYERYCRAAKPCGRIREAELSARGRKAGLWADPAPVPPWEYRSSRRK